MNNANIPPVDPILFFNSAAYYGILDEESAALKLMENIEKRINQEFMEMSGVDLKVNYCESNGVYKIRVPIEVLKKYELEKNQYTSRNRVEVLKLLHKDMFGSAKALSLGEVYLLWMEERQNDPDVSASTKRHDREYYNKYIASDSFGTRIIGTITPEEWHEFFKKITQGRQLYRQSFTNIKSALNLVNDFAVRNGYARHNNCREINPGAYKYKVSYKRTKVFTKDEVVALYSFLKESNNIYDLCLALHLCFPCRIGEVKALTKEDVDLDNRKLHISKEVVESDHHCQILVDHTKSGLEEGNRDLYIPDAAMSVLDKILAKTKNEELFIGKTGKWLLTQELNSHLRDACDALGIEYLSTHKARAWFATECAKLGMDEVTMTRTFGWKDRDTAKEYIRAARTETAQKEAIEQIVNF